MLSPLIISYNHIPIVGDGKLDHDGREELRNKYFLSEKQFQKLAQPDMVGTKLHMLEGFYFSGLSDRLLNIHRSQRNCGKILLRLFEISGARPGLWVIHCLG